MIVGSLSYVALTWWLAPHRSMPWHDATEGDWPMVFHQVVTMELPHLAGSFFILIRHFFGTISASPFGYCGNDSPGY